MNTFPLGDVFSFSSKNQFEEVCTADVNVLSTLLIVLLFKQLFGPLNGDSYRIDIRRSLQILSMSQAATNDQPKDCNDQRPKPKR